MVVKEKDGIVLNLNSKSENKKINRKEKKRK